MRWLRHAFRQTSNHLPACVDRTTHSLKLFLDVGTARMLLAGLVLFPLPVSQIFLRRLFVGEVEADRSAYLLQRQDWIVCADSFRGLTVFEFPDNLCQRHANPIG